MNTQVKELQDRVKSLECQLGNLRRESSKKLKKGDKIKYWRIGVISGDPPKCYDEHIFTFVGYPKYHDYNKFKNYEQQVFLEDEDGLIHDNMIESHCEVVQTEPKPCQQ
jgi:hypothetical protein